MMEDIPIEMELRNRVRLCFHEAVTNAVVHGNKYDSSKKVFIKREFSNSKLAFYIQDEGQGFDYRTVADPTIDENLTKESGRGIFILKEFACHSEYCPEKKMMRIEFHF